jgi:hypothetical protein
MVKLLLQHIRLLLSIVLLCSNVSYDRGEKKVQTVSQQSYKESIWTWEKEKDKEKNALCKASQHELIT